MIITTDPNYQKSELEKSKGEDFIVFRPYIFKVKCKDLIKDWDFQELVRMHLRVDHCYFNINSNIGYLVLNLNESICGELIDRLQLEQ